MSKKSQNDQSVGEMVDSLVGVEPVSLDKLAYGYESLSADDMFAKYGYDFDDEPTIYDRFSEVIEEYGQNIKDLHVSLTIFDGEKEVKTIQI